MEKLKNISLKYQIIIIIFFISLASLWVASTALVLYDRYAYKKNMEYELVIFSRIIANQNAHPMALKNYQDVQRNLELIGVKNGIVSACITNAVGEIIAQYSRDESIDKPECLSRQIYISRFSYKYLDLLQPIMLSGSTNVGELHMRQDFVELNKRFKIYSVVLLFIFILAAIVAVFLSFRMQGFISNPILKLTEISENIAHKKDYSLRASLDRKDEIGKLLAAFNSMLDTIYQQDKELKEAKNLLEIKIDERTSELKNINRELEAFVYSVSHDLRAPLRSIDGFSAALMEDFGGNMGATEKDYLMRITAASHRMAVLIDSLLKLSQVSQQKLNIAAVNLAGLANDIARDLYERYPDQKVLFLCPDLILDYADNALMISLLANLLDNAWKYTSKTTEACIEFGSLDRNGEMVYFVRDNGVGFDMKYAEKLFAPFQRMHRHEDFEGLGIGLATSARIIHRHGGEIWAESSSGQGAVFYFTLNNHHESMTNG
jgi:signal transduction histidine kinase